MIFLSTFSYLEKISKCCNLWINLSMITKSHNSQRQLCNHNHRMDGNRIGDHSNPGGFFLGMMATVNVFFGGLNDILNSALAILIAVLAWMLYFQFHAKAPLASQVTLVLAVLGAILAMVGSVLVIFRFTGFVLAEWHTGFGCALLSLWLASFYYFMLGSGVYPKKWVIFGSL